MTRKRSANDKAPLFEYYYNVCKMNAENQGLEFPDYVIEHEFSKDVKSAFDIAFLHSKVAVEIDGGVHEGKNRGRHLRAGGFTKDLIKINLAHQMGWIVMRYTPQMLENDPDTCIRQVLSVIEERTPSRKHDESLDESLARSIEWLCPNCNIQCAIEIRPDHIRAECGECDYFEAYGG
jgi:hypothetical protein